MHLCKNPQLGILYASVKLNTTINHQLKQFKNSVFRTLTQNSDMYKIHKEIL